MGETQPKILLVEDEKAIRDAASAYLRREGFEVVSVEDGQKALDEFVVNAFDLVILDLMLPSIQGEEVCSTIRKDSDIPIIILTAKGETENRIAGLELGADDYLVKPFSLRELVARVRAILRRTQRGDEPNKDIYEFGDLIINLTEHAVFHKGNEVELTASEFKLLTTLAQAPGRVFSRMELVERVLSYTYEGYERTIDSHVKNLRAKIGDDSRNPIWIQTVHGVGYRFLTPTPPAVQQ